jgi:hypothetical protein
MYQARHTILFIWSCAEPFVTLLRPNVSATLFESPTLIMSLALVLELLEDRDIFCLNRALFPTECFLF